MRNAIVKRLGYFNYLYSVLRRNIRKRLLHLNIKAVSKNNIFEHNKTISKLIFLYIKNKFFRFLLEISLIMRHVKNHEKQLLIKLRELTLIITGKRMGPITLPCGQDSYLFSVLRRNIRKHLLYLNITTVSKSNIFDHNEIISLVTSFIWWKLSIVFSDKSL